jgi:hypothetical protein
MTPQVCRCAHTEEFHIDEPYVKGCTAVMGFKMDKKGLYEAVYCNCRGFELWNEGEDRQL